MSVNEYSCDQAEKSTTGKERSSQLVNLSTTKSKFVEINIQSGLSDFRVYFLLEECKKANSDVVFMQERHQLISDTIAHLG